VSSDAIVILKEDHKRIKKLFAQFHEAGPGAHQRKGQLVDKIIEELTVHTYLENEVMYPQVRRLVPELEQEVLESYEEHHVADLISLELAALSPQSEHFDAKATVLIENVSHHIEEEETEWFPRVRQALSRKQLTEIGTEIEELRPRAPHKLSQPSALKKAFDAVVS
jgi:hemerythrin-like domain-containing protein